MFMFEDVVEALVISRAVLLLCFATGRGGRSKASLQALAEATGKEIPAEAWLRLLPQVDTNTDINAKPKTRSLTAPVGVGGRPGGRPKPEPREACGCCRSGRLEE